MEPTTIAAELFKQAEKLQNEARDLNAKTAAIYNAAVALKHLAVTVADKLNPEPEIQDTVVGVTA